MSKRHQIICLQLFCFSRAILVNLKQRKEQNIVDNVKLDQLKLKTINMKEEKDRKRMKNNW